ncbi:MAG TPA: hypothetical protein ENH10_01900, partial [Bacteroidetes bacterium]|nr:hypothetical protein [Bacteroidota bacterium]HEX03895.1 hypothetical protein [Bacteroidota bacterium]
MNRRKLNLELYNDEAAIQRGEPGIVHSYMRGLATAMQAIGDKNGPAWWMGSSGFAFRIWASDTLCPSAMSMFEFNRILPQAIEQMGYTPIYTSRLWDEPKLELERRMTAHSQIIEAVERGVPAVVWDLSDAEWGVITGYDDGRDVYITLDNDGNVSTLPYERLGQNGVDILAVTIPGEPTNQDSEEVIRRSIEIAIGHASQEEWADRPDYQNGLFGYDLWALVYERWGLLIEAGRMKKSGIPIHEYSKYYAAHFYSARCYAREYLNMIKNHDPDLSNAATLYAQVADQLRLLWTEAPDTLTPKRSLIDDFTQRLQNAKSLEMEAVE